MFFFAAIPWYSWLMFIGVIAGLIILSEIARQNKVTAIALFVILPIILTIFVWPKTAVGTSTGSWFHWVKVYSALAGCIGFALIRLSPKIGATKFKMWFPPVILAVNILEACIRDFQCFGFNGIVDEVMMIGEPWNIMNGIAGILNILVITGFVGIYVSKDRKAMVWPDMLWFYIIAYDVWNIAYVYNCVSDHAFYAGLALNLAPTIAAFTLRKGAWLQHRAHTLAFWMMFTMSWPSFVHDSTFAVQSSHSETALFVLSFAALAINVAVFVYTLYIMKTKKRNPLKQEMYTHLAAYKKVAKSADSKATV